MNPIWIVFRRIIYSIPLKLLLLLLAIFGVLFACFSSADDLWINLWKEKTNWWTTTRDYSQFDRICVLTYNSSNTVSEFSVWWWTIQNTCNWNLNQYDFNIDSSCCSVWWNLTLYSKNSWTDFYVLGINLINENSCPLMSSLQCQTEYNLIPISSVDQNYCTTNNLCPAWTPSDCPNVWVSNLYINDIFHPGAFNVIMNIPEEIDWDYAYTNSWQNFNIDVVWYNQDFEKIEWWINTNNYKPTSEDFTKIFTSFSSFWWLLIACLFVILVFYFIKKMFK